jgi:hypothetical protein
VGRDRARYLKVRLPIPPLSPCVRLSPHTATALLVSFRLHRMTWMTMENLEILHPISAFRRVEVPAADNRVLTTYVGKPPLRGSAPFILPPIVENRDCTEFCYCAVYNSLEMLRGYFHGKNRAGVLGHVAITQSCRKASDLTRADHYFVLWPVRNSLKLKVMRA